jgi:hypothetical protein
MKMRMTNEFIAESRRKWYHGAASVEREADGREWFEVQYVYTFLFTIAEVEMEQLPDLTSSFPLTNHSIEYEMITSSTPN